MRREADYNVDLQLEEPPVTRYRYRRCGRAQAGFPRCGRKATGDLDHEPVGLADRGRPQQGVLGHRSVRGRSLPERRVRTFYEVAGAISGRPTSRRPSCAARRGQGGGSHQDQAGACRRRAGAGRHVPDLRGGAVRGGRLLARVPRHRRSYVARQGRGVRKEVRLVVVLLPNPHRFGAKVHVCKANRRQANTIRSHFCR